MKYHLTRLSMVLFLFTLMSLGVTQNYICTASASSGFRFEAATNEWVSTTFNTDSQYVLAPPTESDIGFTNFQYLLKEIGRDFPSAACQQKFNEDGWLNCGNFRLNSKNNRFILSYTGGYVTVTGETLDFGDQVLHLTDENSGTPYMEIGLCSTF